MEFISRQGSKVVKPANRRTKERFSAYGLAEKNGKILVVKPHANNLYELPGGGAINGENAKDTLAREFLEETGCTIKNFEKKTLAIIKTNFYADDIDEYFDSTMIFFKIKTIENKTHTQEIDSNEIKETKWINPKRLNYINTHQTHLKIIKRFKQD